MLLVLLQYSGTARKSQKRGGRPKAKRTSMRLMVARTISSAVKETAVKSHMGLKDDRVALGHIVEEFELLFSAPFN